MSLILVTILVALNVTVLTSFAQQGVTLQDTRAQAIEVKQRSIETSKKLDTMTEEKIKTETSLREERLKSEQTQKENDDLKVSLQAKKDAEAAATQTQQVQTIVPAVEITGDKNTWLANSGIAASDWGYVDYIITHESGWSPTAWNKGGSGAYGLGQALPASKMAAYGADYMTNPTTQLRWANAYAVGRYGSWAAAYNFWQANSWW